eukprot:COSAG02_NODE_1075_length_14754_cov_18.686796_19_plen_107_part_00
MQQRRAGLEHIPDQLHQRSWQAAHTAPLEMGHRGSQLEERRQEDHNEQGKHRDELVVVARVHADTVDHQRGSHIRLDINRTLLTRYLYRSKPTHSAQVARNKCFPY